MNAVARDLMTAPRKPVGSVAGVPEVGSHDMVEVMDRFGIGWALMHRGSRGYGARVRTANCANHAEPWRVPQLCIRSRAGDVKRSVDGSRWLTEVKP
jgi:hypothetical protein